MKHAPDIRAPSSSCPSLCPLRTQSPFREKKAGLTHTSHEAHARCARTCAPYPTNALHFGDSVERILLGTGDRESANARRNQPADAHPHVPRLHRTESSRLPADQLLVHGSVVVPVDGGLDFPRLVPVGVDEANCLDRLSSLLLHHRPFPFVQGGVPGEDQSGCSVRGSIRKFSASYGVSGVRCQVPGVRSQVSGVRGLRSELGDAFHFSVYMDTES